MALSQRCRVVWPSRLEDGYAWKRACVVAVCKPIIDCNVPAEGPAVGAPSPSQARGGQLLLDASI